MNSKKANDELLSLGEKFARLLSSAELGRVSGSGDRDPVPMCCVEGHPCERDPVRD